METAAMDGLWGGQPMDDLEMRVTAVERDLSNLKDLVLEERRRSNGSLDKIDKRLTEIANTVQKYRDEAQQAAAGKPSWGTAAAITALSSAVVGLATWVITRM